MVYKDILKNHDQEIGIDNSETELENVAMEIVSNSVPNYAYVSDIVKGLRSTPFSNFASFCKFVIAIRFSSMNLK